MLFWVVHEEIMTLESTDVTKLLTLKSTDVTKLLTLKLTDVTKLPYWDKKNLLFSATCSTLHTGLPANLLNQVP